MSHVFLNACPAQNWLLGSLHFGRKGTRKGRTTTRTSFCYRTLQLYENTCWLNLCMTTSKCPYTIYIIYLHKYNYPFTFCKSSSYTNINNMFLKLLSWINFRYSTIFSALASANNPAFKLHINACIFCMWELNFHNKYVKILNLILQGIVLVSHECN